MKPAAPGRSESGELVTSTVLDRPAARSSRRSRRKAIPDKTGAPTAAACTVGESTPLPTSRDIGGRAESYLLVNRSSTTPPTPALLPTGKPAWQQAAAQEVFPGVTPARFDLRTIHRGEEFVWAMSTPAGISVGRARGLPELFDQAALEALRHTPDADEKGATVHYQWSEKLAPYRRDVEQYVKLAYPSVRVMPPRTSAKALWALLGVTLNVSVPRPALPSGESAFREPEGPAGPAPTIIVATDGSLKETHAGWAYITSDGRYAMDFGKRPKRGNNPGVKAHTAVELRAIRLAIRDFREAAAAGQRVHILSDSKVAVAQTRRWLEWHDTLSAMTIEWTAGHAGHPLNEAADRLSHQARVAGTAIHDELVEGIVRDAMKAWAAWSETARQNR